MQSQPHGFEPAPAERADQCLQRRGLASSRAQAQALIAAGAVTLPDGTTVTKASRKIPLGTPLHVAPGPRYVSRAGDKLAAALDAFGLDPTGLTALDLGASTGGFTDCLLQRGAAQVVCVDVGHGQLHPSLRAHPAVVSLEGVNARALDEESLDPSAFDWVVMDLSFISLRLVLAPAWARLKPGGHLVALIKPQFEAGKAVIDAGSGIVRDPGVREAARQAVLAFADTLPGAHLLGWIDSPVIGGTGNHEFLAAWTRQPG